MSEVPLYAAHLMLQHAPPSARVWSQPPGISREIHYEASWSGISHRGNSGTAGAAGGACLTALRLSYEPDGWQHRP